MVFMSSLRRSRRTIPWRTSNCSRLCCRRARARNFKTTSRRANCRTCRSVGPARILRPLSPLTWSRSARSSEPRRASVSSGEKLGCPLLAHSRHHWLFATLPIAGPGTVRCRRASGARMRRREFLGLLGSAVAAWPVTVRAQQSTVPVIGYLSGRSPEDTVGEREAFHKGLSEGGFVDGRNVHVEYRWARGDYSGLTKLAAELVQRRVTVLAATGGDASAHAAKEATATIPVVFNMGGDPVKFGLVQSFNR